MIDNLGGTDRVNNLLAALNMKPVNAKNLKVMERRAGHLYRRCQKCQSTRLQKNLSSRRWSKMINFSSNTTKELE